jgi:predicted nucleotidyltransferase/predicted transcriptional regulator
MSKIHNNTEERILMLLLSNKKDEFTIRSIAKEVNIDYKAVHTIVKRLIADGVLNVRRAGQTMLCSINKKGFNSDVFNAEILRREEILKYKDIKGLSDYLSDIKEPFFIVLLFGSYASGKYRKGSDIDIMVIADDEDILKKAKKEISLVPLKVYLMSFSSSEFLSMLKTTDTNVGKEAEENNVILYGIEDYYRLIKNA